jgi:hypothetical protein
MRGRNSTRRKSCLVSVTSSLLSSTGVAVNVVQGKRLCDDPNRARVWNASASAGWAFVRRLSRGSALLHKAAESY